MEAGTAITIAGLIIASSVTVIDKVTEEYTTNSRALRDVWFVLVLAGLAGSVYGAYKDAQQAGKATRDNDKAIAYLTSSVQKIPNSSADFRQIEDDLTQVLSHFGIRQQPVPAVKLAPAQPEYLVQIAADTSRERLQPYLNTLQSRFGVSTGAAILPPKAGSKWYLLVWGQHLDRAAAEQRAKAADALHLPPSGASAEVKPQY